MEAFLEKCESSPAICIDMTKPIYIVDAVNYLFRSYYAIGPMTNGLGQSTSALYGFIRSIQKLIHTFSPEFLVCVFDGPDNKKERKEVYADYKAHRKGAPEDLFPQFAWAENYCALSGIPTLSIEGVEADDVMGTIALWAKHKQMPVYLCTSDKDMAQLVGPHIFLLHPHKDYLLIDEAKVVELFGVKPNQIVDYLSIIGDASDNIPGIEGFGPKTAAALLQEFGTLDELLAHPERVKGEKKQQTLREQKEIALMSRKLATLNLQVKIPEDIDFYSIKKSNRESLIEFYQKMNFHSLLKEIPEPTHTAKKEYHLIETKEEMTSFLSSLLHEKEIGIDTETSQLSSMLARLVGIGFSTEVGKATYLPCNGKIEKEEVISALSQFFQQTKSSFFGHNLKYDWHVLKNSGIDLRDMGFDTLLASYLLGPQKRTHNLDDLSLELLHHTKIPIESLIGKGKNQISMEEVPIETVKEYCCEDIDYTTRLKERFSLDLKEKGLEKVFYEIEMPLLPVLAGMERQGVYLDTERLKEIGGALSKEISIIREDIFKMAGVEFNLNSPKQMSEILFTKLQLSKPSQGKTSFSTGADILEELDHPIASRILEYRSLEKLRTTYVEALPLSIHPETGKIHCTFNQSVAATGRLSCQDPNLQNIPVRTKEGKSIRSCFKPEKKGWSFIGGDYSQIELRLLAHFTEDPELIRAFLAKEDIHAYTASQIFFLPITMITPEMRTLAKAVNFGILYGQSAFGLSQTLKIPLKEAATFIKTYFEQYPSVQAYLEECKEKAKKTGVATTLTGRTRPIPEIHNKNPSIRSAAERLAVNTPLQGTAADLIKKAMIAIAAEIQKQNLRGKMILQIHDELIFEVPDEEILTFRKMIQDKMENVFKFKVPIEVDISVGKNWAEC